MANNCMTEFEITTATEQDAERLFHLLNAAKLEAEKKIQGFFIGSESRYFFDADIYYEGNTLGMYGWVKWGFADEEIAVIIKWFMAQAGIRNIRVIYDEAGCLLRGEFNYASGEQSIVHTYLPEKFYPEDSDAEDYYDEIEKRYAEHKATEEISL